MYNFRIDFDKFLNELFDGFLVCKNNDEFEILYSSDGANDLLKQFYVQTLIGMSFLSIFSEKEKEEFIEKASKKSKIFMISKLSIKNNIYRNVAIQSVFSEDISENMDAIYIFFTDITCISSSILKKQNLYETALNHSGINIFEYIVKTQEVILSSGTIDLIDLTKLSQKVYDPHIKKIFINEANWQDFIKMIQEINNGTESSTCNVYVHTKNREIKAFDIVLINVYDEKDKPISAVGIAKDITELRMYEKEKEYIDTMSVNKSYIFEANLTRNEIINSDDNWLFENNIPKNLTYNKLLNYICENLIEEQFQTMVKNKLSASYILRSYYNGKRQISFEYRQKISDSQHSWFSSNVNIIKDSISGDIFIRYFATNINDSRMQEFGIGKRYDALISNILFMYEVNYTTNHFLRCNDEKDEFLGVKTTENYCETLDIYCENIIYHDDVFNFRSKMLLENVLKSYKEGLANISCEYRRADINGNYNWVKSTVQLHKDPENGDVIGYIFIEDINDKKKKEIDLEYRAEHDKLTGCFNREAATRKITDYLLTDEGRHATHAFIIFDIDNFKNINDTAGHLEGDNVLSQMSDKVHKLFRSMDIIARIGGDEFVIFMKNIGKTDIVISKALELCNRLKDTIFYENSELNVSVSVGIAIYDQDGFDYNSLYINADIALYVAKQKGKNQFAMYKSSMRKDNLVK